MSAIGPLLPLSLPLPPLLLSDARRLISFALHEDLRFTGDVTCAATVPAGARLRGTVRAKEAGVVCGLWLFALVADEMGSDLTVTDAAADGMVVRPGDEVLHLHGDATSVLIVERTALNLCQRLSGTATLTRRYVDAVAGTRAQILDTRKTTPGMRLLQKHAVACGGGHNHRIGLYDQILIKENHIALMAGGDAAVTIRSPPAEAVRRCRERHGPAMLVEVEIERLDDLEPCISAGADIILLDNLPPDQVREAVARRNAVVHPTRPVRLEASGGITLGTVRSFAEAGVDRISTGELTHSVRSLDLSLRCSPA
jgi:nicotinate-nucleotide pyrophosphorylase (carboxylating)